MYSLRMHSENMTELWNGVSWKLHYGLILMVFGRNIQKTLQWSLHVFFM